MQTVANLKAVLLVGGLGTRLRTVVPSTAKPMASVGDRPFLELLVRQLRSQGIRRLVMCTGYRARDIQHAMGDGSSWDVEIEYSAESEPRGTAGAIKLAQPFVGDSAEFLVLNGDSFVEMEFGRLVRFHNQMRGIASIAVVRTENVLRYGTVGIERDGRVVSFSEKTNAQPGGLINAGVYVFNPEIFDFIADRPLSLEKDIFPNLLGRGVYALEQEGIFIDIGTPEDYARAQELSARMLGAASGKHPSSLG